MTENLVTKIAKASQKVGALNADKINKDQNYKYISADKILERCGDALASFGVIVMPQVDEAQYTTTERQGKSPRIDANVYMTMTITDGEKELKATWQGCGSDYMTPDKALYKAITSGHKYFLMKLLNVGIGNEDSEHEADDDDRQQPRPTPQQPRPQQPAMQQPKPQPQPQTGGAFDGLINPKMIVDAGLAENVPNAVQIINKLNIAGKPAAQYMQTVQLYRRWRDAGHDTDAAAVAALAGEIPA